MTAPVPPEDRARSPYTGWTRAHWEAAADLLLDGVAAYASKRGALYDIPGRTGASGALSDGLEGFARTFLLAAFRIAGARARGLEPLVARYTEGLVEGTDPGSDEAWPPIEDSTQPMVEAASIAIGLYETRPWIWDVLDDAARNRVATWLSGVNGKRALPNNWLLFNVTVNAFLKSVDAPHRQDEIERNLDLIDAMYRGDGWYSDGFGRNFDHYVGWAMHLYTLLWCRMDGDGSDPSRAAVYRSRLRRYLEDARVLVAADGAPVHQGRSLLYRFASAAPFWAGALCDATPLAPGETRRIASGMVKHFLDKPVLRDGALAMGWYEEYLPMTQPYSGPASPYWASKAFLGLLLGPDDPVWTAREEPAPIDEGDVVRAIQAPCWLVNGTRADGIVRLANHGSDRWPWRQSGDPDPHYRKLAYATHAAPGTGAADPDDVDGQFALLDAAGSRSVRARLLPIAAVDRFAGSVHHPGEARANGMPTWDERVETVTIAHGPAQIRIHHVTCYEPRRAREGGFCVAAGDDPGAESSRLAAIVRRDDGLWSGIWGLHGYDDASVARYEDANALGRRSAVPVLSSRRERAAESVYVSLVALAGGAFDAAAVRASVLEVRVRGRTVVVTCEGGTTYVVRLVAPAPVDVQGLDGPVRFARLDRSGEVFVHRC